MKTTHTYVVSIGIDSYQHISQLSCAAHDAEDLAKVSPSPTRRKLNCLLIRRQRNQQSSTISRGLRTVPVPQIPRSCRLAGTVGERVSTGRRRHVSVRSKHRPMPWNRQVSPARNSRLP